MVRKSKDHLQCGCRELTQPNNPIFPSDPSTKGKNCECTIQTSKGFKRKKGGGILRLKYSSIHVGQDASIK